MPSSTLNPQSQSEFSFTFVIIEFLKLYSLWCVGNSVQCETPQMGALQRRKCPSASLYLCTLLCLIHHNLHTDDLSLFRLSSLPTSYARLPLHYPPYIYVNSETIQALIRSPSSHLEQGLEFRFVFIVPSQGSNKQSRPSERTACLRLSQPSTHF
jgi:hypothetical protein